MLSVGKQSDINLIFAANIYQRKPRYINQFFIILVPAFHKNCFHSSSSGEFVLGSSERILKDIKRYFFLLGVCAY